MPWANKMTQTVVSEMITFSADIVNMAPFRKRPYFTCAILSFTVLKIIGMPAEHKNRLLLDREKDNVRDLLDCR